MLSELPVHHLALFAAAALAVNLTPGPDMLFVVGTGATRGRRAGVMAALGIGACCTSRSRRSACRPCLRHRPWRSAW
jgi:hypothetical protein